MVEKLEAMTPDERFEFWRGELSTLHPLQRLPQRLPGLHLRASACLTTRCIRRCSNKAAADDFEENMFHIIRAFHVAGRCTDCGECSRVCPQHIPLHLLNRKFIKDINELYGDYQAGEDIGSSASAHRLHQERRGAQRRPSERRRQVMHEKDCPETRLNELFAAFAGGWTLYLPVDERRAALDYRAVAPKA